MTLLPVLHREMRTAARNANTYRVRLLAALFAVMFTGFSIWFVTLFNESPIPPRELFAALSVIEFIFILVAGFSLTADAISEEKRESTLSLLILAGLKPWDVVFGKLAAASVRGFMALLGTLPVLAVPILLGGTDAQEFLRIGAVLCCSLLFSMSAGLMFSAIFQKGWTAFAFSAGLVLFFCAALPLGTVLAREFQLVSFDPDFISVASPSYALSQGFAFGLTNNRFAIALLLMLFLSLAMQAAAIAILPLAWKDRPSRLSIIARFRQSIAFGSATFRRGFRRRLLDVNPVYWLNSRPRIAALGLLCAMAAVPVANCLALSQAPIPPHLQEHSVMQFMAWIFTSGAVHSLVLLRIPIVAAERFSEDAKTGALELLLSTPASVPEILYGHWLALRRYFAGPALLALLVHAVTVAIFVAIQPVFFGRHYSLVELLSFVVQRVTGGTAPLNWENGLMLLAILAVFPSIFLNWFSLACLGTWLSLRVRRTMMIPFAAFVLTLLPPAFMLGTLAAVKEYNRWVIGQDLDEIFYMASAWIFHAGTQLFWIAFCVMALLSRFRRDAAERYHAPRKRRWWHFGVA